MPPQSLYQRVCQLEDYLLSLGLTFPDGYRPLTRDSRASAVAVAAVPIMRQPKSKQFRPGQLPDAMITDVECND